MTFCYQVCRIPVWGRVAAWIVFVLIAAGVLSIIFWDWLSEGESSSATIRNISAAQLQRFASVHGIVQNLFRVSRHLLRSAHHRLLRTRAFVEWDAVTCAC